MRAYTPFNVLLVDDEPSILDSIQALLSESQPAVDAQNDLFQLRHVQRLSLGLEVLAQSTDQGDRQVVLLDLNLPDSQGIATVEKMRHIHPEVPVIVLTGVSDEVVAVQVIESGAQGFLSKDNLDPNLLAYALLLAADRQRHPTVVESTLAENTLAPIQERPPRRTEIEHFERLANSVRPATITSQLFESGLLKETVPDIFEQMVDTYSQILDQALEQKMFRVAHPISERLRSLAEQLGFLKAGARDVVELHTLALKKKSEQENVMRVRVYAEEGRLIVLELMGYL
ncbi:MAG: response regulator, partial [Phormidesmis sp.]